MLRILESEGDYIKRLADSRILSHRNLSRDKEPLRKLSGTIVVEFGQIISLIAQKYDFSCIKSSIFYNLFNFQKRKNIMLIITLK